MKVKKIKLQNFRNYDNEELDFNDSRNIVIGENAQGKTNLAEAVYICSFGRSFRTNNSGELVSFGHEHGSIEALIESQEIEKKLEIILNSNGKKMISKDGKALRNMSELLNNIVVVIFSPEDLRLIKDNPEKRRNFINRDISQIRPGYYEQFRRYNEALKHKNSILKDARNQFDEATLNVYDMQLATSGFELIKYRREFIEKISEKANEIQNAISGGKENLSIKYSETISPTSVMNMYDQIVACRERDIYNACATKGPHRDDLEFYINGKDAKKYGSQGQQRTIALSLKLAEVKIVKEVLGENPILILDDVLSELDMERQNYLINEIEDVQLFITSTDVNNEILGRMHEASIFSVNKGKITTKIDK